MWGISTAVARAQVARRASLTCVDMYMGSINSIFGGCNHLITVDSKINTLWGHHLEHHGSKAMGAMLGKRRGKRALSISSTQSEAVQKLVKAEFLELKLNRSLKSSILRKPKSSPEACGRRWSKQRE